MKTKKTPILMWAMWALAASFITLMFMMQTSMGVMIPNIMRDFDIDTLGIGLLSSYFFYSYIIFQVPAGILVDRYKPRRILTAAIILCATGTLLFALSAQLWQAVGARFIMGMGAAPSMACALYVGLRRFPPHRFAMIAGLTEMLGMIGGFIGQAGLAPSVASFGWRHTLFACAAVIFLLSIAVWFVLQDKAPHDPIEEKRASLKDNIEAILADGQVWLSGLFAALKFAILPAFGGLWAVPYFQKLYHTDLATAGFASGMIFIGAAIGTPIIGYISDRIQRRKLPMIGSTLVAFLLSLIIIYSPPTHIAWMFVLTLFLGIFSSGYVIPFALTKDLVRVSVQGAAMAFTNTLCIIIGAPILQPLIGGLLRYEDPAAVSTKEILYSIHDYHIALVVIPITLVLALVCTFFIKETHCQAMVTTQ